MPNILKRRDFLGMMSGALAGTAMLGSESNALSGEPMPADITIAGAKSTSDELDFVSALSAAEAIRRKRVSSVELTQHTFDRIERYNPQLNAFVYQLREDALVRAQKADQALTRGENSGPFHGVPIHVKECFGVAGRPCTWGFESLRDSKAAQNSEAVERLLRAGAILISATNVPVNLSDWQTYNPIYGTTNNPWDVKRTPGGSSGGSAAALAAGLGYLSIGSDIGGSIRIPAHFCGVYGHKPTLDLVSTQGMSPGGNYGTPGFSTLLAVAGPMARTPSDLLAAMKVLGGPVAWDKKAWIWGMPAPRATTLKDFRIGYVIDDPIAPPTPEVKARLEYVIRTLEGAGAKLKSGWPAEFNPAALLDTYRFHLYAFLFSISPPEEQHLQRVKFASSQDPDARGALSSFADWQQQNFRRLAFRAQWQSHFEQVDVFLSPVGFSAAFPHDHTEPQEQRTIATSAGPRRYLDLFNWIAPATLTGCPATVEPIGRTDGGLPVGIQIMGSYWEDATTITFADLLSREIGGFTSPPGFEGVG